MGGCCRWKSKNALDHAIKEMQKTLDQLQKDQDKPVKKTEADPSDLAEPNVIARAEPGVGFQPVSIFMSSELSIPRDSLTAEIRTATKQSVCGAEAESACGLDVMVDRTGCRGFNLPVSAPPIPRRNTVVQS